MHWCKFILLLHAIVVAALTVSGCTTSPDIIRHAHWQYLGGNPQAAALTLASAEQVPTKDKLLYLLEKGMYQHYAGNYEASNKELLRAAAYVDNHDYISLRDEAKELFANEWSGNYLGEYSERLWVHSILMMNFLQLGQYESAAVEARRALQEIDARPRVHEQDYFTRALIAFSLEAAGQTNDSYIVNRKLANKHQVSGLNTLLMQQADSLGFTNDFQELQTNGALSVPDAQQYAIIFIAEGRIPQKYSGSLITDEDTRIAFPEYVVPTNSPVSLEIKVNDEPCSNCLVIHSDFGQLVNKSLASRASSLAAKTLVRTVFKEAVAEAVEKEDEFVGGIARLLLFALEEADTRSWQSLPRHFSMIRVPLPADDTTQRIALNGSRAGVVFNLESSADRFRILSTSTREFDPLVAVH